MYVPPPNFRPSDVPIPEGSHMAVRISSDSIDLGVKILEILDACHGTFTQ